MFTPGRERAAPVQCKFSVFLEEAGGKVYQDGTSDLVRFTHGTVDVG